MDNTDNIRAMAEQYPYGTVKWVTHYFTSRCNGDMSFMDRICKSVKHNNCTRWYHIDSYSNDHNGIRFQGTFFSAIRGEDPILEESIPPPLILLKYASDYRWIHNGDYICWTIWFDKEDIQEFL